MRRDDIEVIGDTERDQNGLIFLLIGDGKGKTTSALGMAMRAAGWNQPLIFIQFMKKRPYGELFSFEKLGERFEIYQMGREEHVIKGNPSDEDFEMAKRAMKMVRESMGSREYDWLFLDEAVTAIDYGLLSEDDLITLLNERPSYINIVLTGRGEPKKLIELADCVTRMQKVKHHYDKGIAARKGVEF